MTGSESKSFDIDYLQLYYEIPFSPTPGIVIRQPTVGEIMEFGEHDFYSTLNVFIGNTTMFRLPLWEHGYDWNKMTDYELFCNLISSVDKDATHLLFGDLDFDKFQGPFLINKPNEESYVALCYEDTNIEITETTYKHMALYLRTMFGIFPKNEFGKDKTTKEAIIWEDRQNRALNSKKESSSFLLPLISSCVNHPGFKYKKKELVDVGINEFMDSVQRLQLYESTTALLRGSYSGFVDTSKIDKNEFNFMRDFPRVA